MMVGPASKPVRASTSLRTRWQGKMAAAKPMMVRAGLAGMCLGIAIIGLLENTGRFSDPGAIYTDARLEAGQIGQVGQGQNDGFARTDRLTALLP